MPTSQSAMHEYGFIDCLVNAVYVYGSGKVVVTLNYKGGTKPVSADEIEIAFGVRLCTRLLSQIAFSAF